MFKHSDSSVSAPKAEQEKTLPTVEEKIHGNSEVPSNPAQSSSARIQELLEKNLKWSQIIYEQNRKINHKLWWAAVAGWLRLLIILVPLVVGLIFLSPLFKDLNCLMRGGANCTNKNTQNFMEGIIKLLPLNSNQQSEINQIIK